MTASHLFAACGFVANAGGRKTKLEKLTQRELINAWKSTRQGLDATLNLIRGEFGLVNMRVLWSGALLVPPAAIFATASVRQRDAKGIAGWIALAALHHRYSKAAGTTLEQDLRACTASDPLDRLLRNIRSSSRKSLRARPGDFSGKLNDKSALFSVYVACMHRGARDFESHGKIILQPNIDRHHILPRSLFPSAIRSLADQVANIAFIASAENSSIRNADPSYLANYKSRVLGSHCIPEKRQLWSVKRAEEFFEARQSLLAAAFNDFLTEMLPNRRL